LLGREHVRCLRLLNQVFCNEVCPVHEEGV
jgi:hypothetical protein